MVSVAIVIINKCLDLNFQVHQEEMVVPQGAVFQGLMPSLDLALYLRMIWCTPDVSHFLVAMSFIQFARNIAGAVFQ